MSEEVYNEAGNALCARCQAVIICLPNDISHCACNAVKLTAEEYRYINAQYQQCVCNRCLEELKKEYHSKHHFNRPDNSIFRKYDSLVWLMVFFCQTLSAQVYPPGVGQPGTTAMYKDSSAFVNWAVACSVQRGNMDVSDPSLGLASAGEPSFATGKALSNGQLSLGDGGQATCTFQLPIMDGPGPDFAVFENSFDDTFLELAFVEVSSDGVNFVRFPAKSLSDTVNQTSSFGPTDPTKLHNLAGKYRAGYGTPFDLSDLPIQSSLNLQNVTYVRVIDVIGSVNSLYASRDSEGRKVNDPWPTPFPSGGFDFDAIGVIHENVLASVEEQRSEHELSVWPNPARAGEQVNCRSTQGLSGVELLDPLGRILSNSSDGTLSTGDLAPGIYQLRIKVNGAFVSKRLLIL